MARAIWTGAVSFGLVSVPVGLYSATEDHTVHFSQFERDTPDRIRYKRVNEQTGEEVDYSDIVKGYDIGGGDYVIVTPDELDEMDPGRSRTIDISDFVDQSDIDPVYYQKSYYLAPQGEGAERPYGLLLQAMGRANRVGIATFVMRGREYLAAVRAQGSVLVLETMFFADEIRDPARELDTLPADQSFDEREMKMALSLIDSMTVDWKPDSYRDTYRERVMELIEAKRRGEEVVTEGEPADTGKVVDLMQALERSLESARGRGGGAAGGGRGRGATGGGGGADGGGGGRDESDDLDGLSRDELYQMAQRLDLAGRSKMSRSQLLAAVRQAAGDRTGRGARAS
ncbi:MAG TPA: Ku protein [Acidimicrobiales bacterium]|nr:Ku protein [Acidimicrobiales bacterium]